MKTSAMIVTETERGTFTVLDANGRVHEAFSEEELGMLCRRIVNDPTLPQYASQAAQVANLESVVTQVTETVLPNNFKFLAIPAVGLLKRAVNGAVSGIRSLQVDRGVHQTSTDKAARKARAVASRQRKEEAERRKKEAREAVLQSRKKSLGGSTLRGVRRYP